MILTTVFLTKLKLLVCSLQRGAHKRGAHKSILMNLESGQ